MASNKTKMLSASADFMNKIQSGNPLLWVKTHEEQRALTQYVREISKKTIKNSDTGVNEKYSLYTWDVADGIREISIKEGCLALGEPIANIKPGDPVAPLKWLEDKDTPENSILILKDYHFYLDGKTFSTADIVRRNIRNLITRNPGKTLVILSPVLDIPIELDKSVNVVDFKLPTRDDLKIVLKGVCESAGMPEARWPKGAEEETLIDAAMGMTSMEAENAFSLPLIVAGAFDPVVVRKEKSNIVKKSGILEVIEASETMDDIGGLEILKQYLIDRKDSSTVEAKEFGVQAPRGLLFVGVPGCGKSLTAKATASTFGWPLLRLDMGNVFGSYVGESEHNMQKCMDIIDAVSPCCLWIDEIEKDLAGNKTGTGQEGHETTKKVFKMLLTWLNEHKSEVMLVATANSVQSLPPELLRAGRIDKIFWVDLPDAVQRAEIFKIHLKKIGRKADLFDKDMNQLVTVSTGFSGAEIEVWIKEALIKAFSSKHKELTLQDLLDTVGEITPISRLMATEIKQSREWLQGRGCKNASIVRNTPAETTGTGKRKISAQPSTDPEPEIPDRLPGPALGMN